MRKGYAARLKKMVARSKRPDYAFPTKEEFHAMSSTL